MPSADSCFQKSVKGSLFLLQKAPSIWPLSFSSYEVNARFGKKFSFKSTAEEISLRIAIDYTMYNLTIHKS